MFEIFLITTIPCFIILLAFNLLYLIRSDPVVRAKLKRFISHKPFGVAYFHIGNAIFPKVINFESDIITSKDKIWTITNNTVLVQKEISKGVYEEEGKKFDYSKFIQTQQGVPIVHFDYELVIPLKYGEYDALKIPSSSQIQSTMKKWMELREAELMYNSRDKIKKLIMVVVVMIIIAIAVSAFSAKNTLDILEHLKSIGGVV